MTLLAQRVAEIAPKAMAHPVNSHTIFVTLSLVWLQSSASTTPSTSFDNRTGPEDARIASALRWLLAGPGSRPETSEHELMDLIGSYADKGDGLDLILG